MINPRAALFTAIGDALTAAGLTVYVNPRPGQALPYVTMHTRRMSLGWLDVRESEGLRSVIRITCHAATQTQALTDRSTVMETLDDRAYGLVVTNQAVADTRVVGAGPVSTALDRTINRYHAAPVDIVFELKEAVPGGTVLVTWQDGTQVIFEDGTEAEW